MLADILIHKSDGGRKVRLQARFKLEGLRFAGINSLYLAHEIEWAARSRKVVKILDIGSGNGVPWQLVGRFLGPVRIDLTTVDAFEPELKDHGFSRIPQKGKLNSLWGDLKTVLGQIETSSFDLVVAMDVIEHLSKEDGYLMLYEMNRIAGMGFGISAPNGFDWQPPSPINPFQAHISSWSTKEFRLMGFKIKTYNGLKALTGSFGQKMYPLRLLTGPIFLLENMIGRTFKRSASSFWAFRRGSMPTFEYLGETATSKLIRELEDDPSPIKSQNY